MAAMLPLKVYLHAGATTPEIRRVSIPATTPWPEARELLGTLFNAPIEGATFVDDEGDRVVLGSEEDWRECVALMGGAPPLRLHVERRAPKPTARHLARKALLVMEKGNYERALQLLEEAGPSAVNSYNKACCHSLLGRPEPALALLRAAIDEGYDNGPHMAADPDLAALRPLPEFQALLRHLHTEPMAEEASSSPPPPRAPEAAPPAASSAAPVAPPPPPVCQFFSHLAAMAQHADARMKHDAVCPAAHFAGVMEKVAPQIVGQLTVLNAELGMHAQNFLSSMRRPPSGTAAPAPGPPSGPAQAEAPAASSAGTPEEEPPVPFSAVAPEEPDVVMEEPVDTPEASSATPEEPIVTPAAPPMEASSSSSCAVALLPPAESPAAAMEPQEAALCPVAPVEEVVDVVVSPVPSIDSDEEVEVVPHTAEPPLPTPAPAPIPEATPAPAEVAVAVAVAAPVPVAEAPVAPMPEGEWVDLPTADPEMALKLTKLQELGFWDVKRNVEVLQESGGSLSLTINRLLMD